MEIGRNRKGIFFPYDKRFNFEKVILFWPFIGLVVKISKTCSLSNTSLKSISSDGHILRKIVKKYNLDPICFHELRHTCASLLINSGVDPKTVSKRLGHSDTSITMEIYTHAFEESKNACADRFDEMMKKLENA